MKYKLDSRINFNESLLFWIQKYLYDVITRLRSRHIENEFEYNLHAKKLSIDDVFENIEELEYTLKIIRSLGDRGIANYSYPLIKLYRYLTTKNLVSLVEINDKILTNFLYQLTLDSEVTRDNTKKMIALFFKYIDTNNGDYTQYSHTFGIEFKNYKSNKTNSLPDFLNENELKLFKRAIEEKEYPKQPSCMNKLIAKILLYTGIRVDELINIKKQDIYIEEDIFKFKILGKGNKERIITIRRNKISKNYNDWISVNKYNAEYLFITLNKKRISPQYVYTLISSLLKYANIKKNKKGSHLLRHTFASHLYKKTKDILLVQKALGHTDINTVQIYTHLI